MELEICSGVCNNSPAECISPENGWQIECAARAEGGPQQALGTNVYQLVVPAGTNATGGRKRTGLEIPGGCKIGKARPFDTG